MGYCVWVHLRAVTPDEHVAPRKLVLASAPLIFEWMGKCQLAFKQGLNGQNDQRGAKVIFSVGFSRLSGVSVRKWPKAAVCTGCLLYTKGAFLTTGILIILFYFKHVITRKLALRSVQLVKEVKDQQIYHILYQATIDGQRCTCSLTPQRIVTCKTNADNLALRSICKNASFHITLAQVYDFLSSHLGTGFHPRIFCWTPSSFSLSLFWSLNPESRKCFLSPAPPP